MKMNSWEERAQRMLTEYEWRKQAEQSFRKPAWVGAQCVYPLVGRRSLFRRRKWQRWLLFLSLIVSAGILQIPREAVFPTAAIAVRDQQEIQVRRVQSVSYQLPDGVIAESMVLTRSKLLQGKMLLLDAQHPLPDDALPPNTASIVKVGNGMIPVRSLELKTGYQTIKALQELFAALRGRGMGGIYVEKATMSEVQQKKWMIVQMRELMKLHSPEQAAQLIMESCDRPGTGELLQEYTVELCIINPATNLPETRRPEESEQGQALLQLAWRCGWIRTDRSHPYRFRYVGKAHATAMTYLDLELKEYLMLLQQKGTLAITAGGELQYLILCQPLKGERVAFDLPEGADYEASLDNMGYAVVACTF